MLQTPHSFCERITLQTLPGPRHFAYVTQDPLS